jgi:hypothetical protein
MARKRKVMSPPIPKPILKLRNPIRRSPQRAEVFAGDQFLTHDGRLVDWHIQRGAQASIWEV